VTRYERSEGRQGTDEARRATRNQRRAKGEGRRATPRIPPPMHSPQSSPQKYLRIRVRWPHFA
jgi:hypothetical protein